MVRQGVTVKDVPADAFIKEYAAHLKKSGQIHPPSNATVLKTARHKELSPIDGDWYFVRAASIARKVYLRKGTSVGQLRQVYGGKWRRGTAPPRFSLASGGILRKILQDLEKAKIVSTIEGANGGGRTITDEGQRALDSVACKIVNGDE